MRMTITEAGLKYLFKQSALAELDSILVELATSSKVESIDEELPFKSCTVFQKVWFQHGSSSNFNKRLLAFMKCIKKLHFVCVCTWQSQRVYHYAWL